MARPFTLDSPLAGSVDPPPPAPSDAALRLATQAADLGVATVVAATSSERVTPARRLPRLADRGAVAGLAVAVWNPPGSNAALRLGIPTCRPGKVLGAAARRAEREQRVRDATRLGTPRPICDELAESITSMDRPWMSR